MVRKKTGMPQETEIVLCTITKIYPHCVFANIDDYDNKQGMIHISEISPGRIRNINDFVRIGKKVICKVLSINQEKGHIDLSLRRVSEGQKKEKAEFMKREQKAEKIVEFVAEKLKINKDKLYQELEDKALKNYETLHDCFDDMINDDLILKNFALPKNIHEKLDEVIHQRIKPPQVTIEGELKLTSYAPDGVNIIKEILKSADKSDEAMKIRYKGGGAYNVSVSYADYKGAEKILGKALDQMEIQSKKKECQFDFKRIEKKTKKTAAK